jgi:hypothetical protein
MTKPKPEEIKKELDKEEKDFYGDTTISGQNPDPESDDDTKQALVDVLGNNPRHDENIGNEINKDEMGVVENPPRENEPVTLEENADALENAEQGGNPISEELSRAAQDPFEVLTDADFRKKK